MRTAWILVLSSALACGGSAPSSELATSSQRIVGGAPSDATQESVVRLDVDGEFACTATLVAPNLVLTARHCVADIDETRGDCGVFRASLKPERLTISVGRDAKATGVMGKAIFAEASSDACDTDLALLQLAADVPAAKVSAVRLDVAVLGETASTVGYGDDGSFVGIERPRAQRANLLVDAIGPASYDYKAKDGSVIPVDISAGELVTGESTCSGDSGGPLFDAKNAIIAVTSRGVDDECVDRPSVYAAVSAHRELIEKAFEAAGHPVGATPAPNEPPAGSPQAAPAAPPAPPVTTGGEISVEASGCSAAPRSTPPFAICSTVLAMTLLMRRRRR